MMHKRTLISTLALCLCTLLFPLRAHAQFNDIDETYWYAPYVSQAVSEGIMTGTSPQEFSPYSQMSRAMAAVVFYRLAGSPYCEYERIFPDVDPDTYFSEAVTWAYRNHVISGYGDGTFGPSDPVTREQMMLMAYRYKAEQSGVSWGQVEMAQYNDAHAISDYALQAMQWGLYYNIATAIHGNLHPEQPVTRAESCRILMLAKHLVNGQDPSTIEQIPSDPYSCPHINTQVLTLAESDCEHQGVKEVLCLDCSRELDQELTATSSHQFNWHIIQNADGINYGIRQYQCDFCGYIQVQEIYDVTGEIIQSDRYEDPADKEPGTQLPAPDESETPDEPEKPDESDTPVIDSPSTPNKPITPPNGMGGYIDSPISADGKHDSAVAREIFDLVNQYRQESGLSPLQWGSLCEDKVNVRAIELTVETSHMRPNGQHALEYFMEDSRIERATENIAWYMYEASAEEAMNIWLASPPHAKNIFASDVTHLAVGVFYEKTPTGTNSYFVQCFYSM